MDPLSPNPNLPQTPQPQPMVPRTAAMPPPVMPTQKPPVAKQGLGMLIGFIVMYTLILIAAAYGLVSTQNKKLDDAQKQIASLQAQQPPDESKNIDSSKFQAVFLNGGQVYFGKISLLNPQYLDLANIYYLRTNNAQLQSSGQASSTQDISLVKLGCELHGPSDKMIINRQQVIFWENLKDDGQVVKAINDYVKQNPNGQKC